MEHMDNKIVTGIILFIILGLLGGLRLRDSLYLIVTRYINGLNQILKMNLAKAMLIR